MGTNQVKSSRCEINRPEESAKLEDLKFAGNFREKSFSGIMQIKTRLQCTVE